MTDAMTEKRAKERSCTFEAAIESFLKEERPTLEATLADARGEI